MDSNFFRSNFHDVCKQKRSDQIFNQKQPDRSSPPEPSATLIIHHHHHDDVMKLILFVSILIGVVVNLLPYERRDGSINPVPIVIFGKLPTTTFHAFIISIIFTFTGAFSSMLIRSSGRRVQFSYYEKFCRCYSLVFAAMAMAILVTSVIRSVCQEMQIQIMDA